MTEKLKTEITLRAANAAKWLLSITDLETCRSAKVTLEEIQLKLQEIENILEKNYE